MRPALAPLGRRRPRCATGCWPRSPPARRAPGERLGAERELAARLGVSRSTLRAALDALETAGVVHRVRGRSGGIFVSQRRVERDLTSLTGLPAYLRRQGFQSGARVLSTATHRGRRGDRGGARPARRRAGARDRAGAAGRRAARSRWSAPGFPAEPLPGPARPLAGRARSTSCWRSEYGLHRGRGRGADRGGRRHRGRGAHARGAAGRAAGGRSRAPPGRPTAARSSTRATCSGPTGCASSSACGAATRPRWAARSRWLAWPDA